MKGSPSKAGEHSTNQEKHVTTTITVTQREQLDHTLYVDAARRREDLEKKKEEMEKTRMIGKVEKYVNKKSDGYVIQKFDKQYKQIEVEINESEEIERHSQTNAHGGKNANKHHLKNPDLMSYNTAFKVLTLMGFLPHDKMPSETEKLLLSDFWSLVKIEEHGGVTMDTLRVVLLNVQGIRLPDREREFHEEREVDDYGNELPRQPNNDITKCGIFENGRFYLRKGDHQRIFTHFKNLYIHRVQYSGNLKKVKTDVQNSYANQMQSKPQISMKTTKMAENARKKMMGDKKNVNLVEILLHPSKGKDEWIETQKKHIENKEVEGCTFRPQTLDYHTQGARQATHGDKCLDLFSSRPKGWFVEKQVKTTDEQEYEKFKEECTF